MKYLFTLLTISICYSAFSIGEKDEEIFQKGYFIEYNEKEEGYIYTIDEFAFKFKYDSLGKSCRRLLAKTVSEYKEGEKTYVRVKELITDYSNVAPHTSDEIFVEVILKGKINLYRLNIEKEEKTFLEKLVSPGGHMMPAPTITTYVGPNNAIPITSSAPMFSGGLPSVEFETQGEFFIIEKMSGKFVQLPKQNSDYQKLVTRFVKDDTEVLDMLNGKKWKHKYIVDIIAAYNNQEIPEEFQKKAKKKKNKKRTEKKKKN